MPRSIPVEKEDELKALIQEQPDRTLKELAELYTVRTGVSVSRATIGRMMSRLGYSRKKRLWSPPSGNAPVSSRSGKSFSTPRSTSMGRGSSSSMNQGPISR
jgi:transposase